MAEDVSRLGIRVDSRDVVTADKRLTKMGNTAGKSERQVVKSTAGMKRGFSVAAKAVGGMIAAMASLQTVLKGINQAREFSASLAEVSTLISGTTKELSFLDASAKKLARTFGTDATDQLKGFYQALSAGADGVKGAEEVLRVANKLALGGITSVETGVDALTSAMNVYKDSALTATEASDSLFIAMKFGKTTVGELGSAVGKVIPLSQQLGVSFDETNSIIAALTLGGFRTTEAVTGLRAILAAIVKPTKEASDEAKRLGINFSSAGVSAAGGLIPFLENLQVALDGSKEGTALLFGGVEALVPALALFGEGGRKAAAIMEEMGNKAGATQRAMEKVASALDKRFGIALADINVRMLEFGQLVLKYVVPAVEALSEDLQRIGTYIATAVTGFAAYKVAVIAAATTTAGLSAALGFLRVALIRTGIGALIVGAGELIYQFTLLVEKTGGVGKAFGVMGNYALSVLDTVINKVKTMVNYFTLAGKTLQAVFFTALGDFDKVKEIQKTIDTITADLNSRADVTFIPVAPLQKITNEATKAVAKITELKATVSGVPAVASIGGGSAGFEELLTSLRDQNNALISQIATFNLSSGAVARYTEEQRLLAEIHKNNIVLTVDQTEALNRSLDAVKNNTDALDKMRLAAQVFEATRTPAERLAKKIEELNDLVHDGSINWDTYMRALVQAQDGMDELTTTSKDLSGVVGNDLANSFDRANDSLARFIVTGGSGGLQGILNTLSSIATGAATGLLTDAFKPVSKSIGQSILGAAGSALSLFGFGGLPSNPNVGGFNTRRFADGGFHRGGFRLVGETGRELEATGPSRIFNAQQTRGILSGKKEVTIVSNLTINNSGNGGGQGADPAAAEKIAKAVERQVVQLVRREIFDDKDNAAGRGKIY